MDENPSDKTVTVEIDGLTASWNGREFTGDTELVEAAKRAVELRETVEVFGRIPIDTTSVDPYGALAALSAYRPGRVFVTQAPEELTDWLELMFEANDCQAHEPAGA